MSNTMNFSFDFDEVLEGIKQGLIRELVDVDRDVVIAGVQNSVRKQFEITYEDIRIMKEDLIKEIKESVLEKIQEDIFEKSKVQTSKTLEEFKEEFQNYAYQDFNDLKDEIVSKAAKRLTINIEKNMVATLKAEILENVKDKLKVKSKDDDFCKITTEDYEDLIRNKQMLSALDAAGVDNWTGYDYAMDLLEEWDREKRKI